MGLLDLHHICVAAPLLDSTVPGSVVILEQGLSMWDRRELSFCGLLALAVHGPLIVNDGVYWDGWLLFGYYLNRDLPSLNSMFLEAGSPLTGHLHHFLWWSPLSLIATYKIVIWIALACSTLLVYAIFTKLKIFSRSETLFGVAIFCAYPAYRVQVELILMPVSLAYALFLFGIYLVIRIPEFSGHNRTACVIAAAFISSLSAQVPPFVLFYLIHAPILVWATRRRHFASPATFVELALVLIVPLLSYALKVILWPPHGLYSGYNFVNAPQSPVAFIAEFVSTGVLAQFGAASKAISTQPVVALALVIFAGAALKRSHRLSFMPPRQRAVSVVLVLYAVGLLGVAIAPFFLVGKMMTFNGWDSRHGILLALPVAIGLIAIGRMLTQMLGNKHGQFAPALALFLFAGFIITTWQNYVEWQVRWIKDQSIAVNLRAAPRVLLDQASYIYVEDNDLVLGQKYFFYEYSGLFKMAFGQEKWLGNTAAELTDLRRVAENFPIRRYLLRDFTPTGCSAFLRIKFPGIQGSRLSVALKYQQLRWLRPDQLESWLGTQTNLEWGSVSAQRIADLEQIATALHAYKTMHGVFPRPAGDMARHQAGSSRNSNWIGGLAPGFLPEVPTDPRMVAEENKQYIYISNGLEFKLINHAPEDVVCVQSLRPDLKDPRRPDYAYGIWTEAAKEW